MNNITICNAKISDGLEGKEAVTVTNNVASFRGYETAYTTKNGEPGVKYRNYSFRAYDDVAQRVIRMKLKPGSEVNIFGEMDQYVDKNGKKQHFVRIFAIDFVPSHNNKAKEENSETNASSNPVNLDDSNIFNCKIDEDEELFQ